MKFFLVHLSSKKRLAITEEHHILGRKGTLIHLGQDDLISRTHCKIVQRANGLFIEDLYSLNKTFLNGEALQPGRLVRLKKGDRFELGSQIFRVDEKGSRSKILGFAFFKNKASVLVPAFAALVAVLALGARNSHHSVMASSVLASPEEWTDLNRKDVAQIFEKSLASSPSFNGADLSVRHELASCLRDQSESLGLKPVEALKVVADKGLSQEEIHRNATLFSECQNLNASNGAPLETAPDELSSDPSPNASEAQLSEPTDTDRM